MKSVTLSKIPFTKAELDRRYNCPLPIGVWDMRVDDVYYAQFVVTAMGSIYCYCFNQFAETDFPYYAEAMHHLRGIVAKHQLEAVA